MENMGLFVQTWLEIQLRRARGLTGREEGIVGMEYAVVAAVIIVAVAAALTAGAPAIATIVTAAFARVQGVIP